MPLITDARVEAGTLRSMTCVAPKDLRYSSFLSEAVVMMGEKPESFASWITEWFPLWPTELDPPTTKMGFPAYFPLSSGFN